MNLVKRWNEYMGPKDERLEAVSNRYAKVGFMILLFGSVICCYYGMMLDQVALTADTALATAVGERLVDPIQLQFGAIVVACFVSLYLETRSGITSDRMRLAAVDKVPWDYVAVLSVLTGALLFVLTTGLRIAAEVQIVGVENVTWAGDAAMGVVYFVMGFGLAMGFVGLQFHSAIKRRQELERELEE